MSKNIKKKAKKAKKNVLAIVPVPFWCNRCNACVLGLLLLLLGLTAVGPTIFNPGPDAGTDGTDDDGTDYPDTTPDTTPDDGPIFKLVARLNSWSPFWPSPGYDITVEVFDAASSSKVHSGVMLDEIDIAYNNHEWVEGTAHSSMVSGFMVTIQVLAFGGNLMLTSMDYVDVPVGGAEATYNLYEPTDLAFAVGSVSLKWIIA